MMKALDAVLCHIFFLLFFGNYFSYHGASLTCQYSIILGRSLVFLECWGSIPSDLTE